MRSRHTAREWALRILYAHEMSKDPVDEVFERILADAREDPNLSFCRSLCRRVAEGDQHIDQLIVKAVEKWDIKRIAVLDHVILRMAIAELLYFDDIPYKVTINEAIELAKCYSTAQSGRFVNGILDAISSDLKRSTEPAGDVATGESAP
ncbi:transcription antitermination factor NusB [bacterium]|nr:transcription antitermination factor NusB [bacterium]MBU1984992.1 transcription antitermination factor NusB [bacterium]